MKQLTKVLPASILLLTLVGCNNAIEESENNTTSNLVNTTVSSNSNENVTNQEMSEQLLPLAKELNEEAFIQASLQRVVPALIQEYVPKSLVNEISSLEILSVNSLMNNEEITAPLKAFYEEANTTNRESSFYSLLNSLYASLKTLIANVLTNFFSNTSSSSVITDSSSSLHVSSSSVSSNSSSISSMSSSSSFSSDSNETIENNTTSSSSSFSSSSSSIDSNAILFSEITIDTLPAGEKRSIQVDVKNSSVTYSLQNAPIWMSIDKDSGLLTFDTPNDSTQMYAFEVVATLLDKEYISNTISGHIEKINELLIEESENPNLVEIEETTAQIKSTRYGSTVYVPNNLTPSDESKNTWDVINIYYENYQHNIELVIVDGDTNEVKHEYIDDGAWNGMLNLTSKEGNLYMISVYQAEMRVNVYNPKTNEVAYDVIDFPDDFKYVPYVKTRIGTDGTLFIKGAYNNPDSEFNDSPRYLEIDTATNTIISDNGRGEHIGIPSYPLNFGADDTHVYCVIGVEGGKHQAYAFEREAPHNVTFLAEGPDYSVNILQTSHGVALKHNDRHDFLYKGEMHAPVGEGDWRWTIPPWPFEESYSEADIYRSLRIRYNIVDENLPTKPEIVTQNSVVQDSKAQLFIKQPNSDSFNTFDFEVTTHKSYLNEVIKYGDDKLLISSQAYGPYISYDIKNQTYKEVGSIHLSDYTMLNYTKENGDKVIYMSGYPKGVLFEYDYSKPWTQQKHTFTPGDEVTDFHDQSLNPRWCGSFGFNGSGIHKAFASATGADGYVYFGGQNIRTGNSGGLGWYNPNAHSENTQDDMNGTWQEFSNYAISDMSAVSDAKYIAISTIPVTDNLLNKPKADNGRLFLFDVYKKEIVAFWDPLKDLKLKTGDIINTDGPYILGFTHDSDYNGYIYRINMLNGKLDYRIKIEDADIYTSAGDKLKLDKDGNVHFFLKGTLSSIDPVSGNIRVGNKYIELGSERHGYEGAYELDNSNAYILRYKGLYKAINVID